jgi:DNA-binding MarR family transcriptional regulator
MPTPVERDILYHLLIHGDDSSGNIADETERDRSGVSKRLKALEDDGLVREKGRGVYCLTLAGIAAAREIARSRDRDDPPPSQ